LSRGSIPRLVLASLPLENSHACLRVRGALPGFGLAEKEASSGRWAEEAGPGPA
jgi:hypothetical protein